MHKDLITYLGKTTFRGQAKQFGIKTDDRRRHAYIIGKTGMGKSVLLENLAIQDIKNGNGLAFIDPHGEAAESIIKYVPQERVKDVIYFNPADMEFPISFNVMEDVPIERRHLVSAGLMGVFKKIWPDVWSARMEYILSNCVLALLENPGATLLGINWMLSDADYRQNIISNVKDPVVRAFWEKEYSRYSQKYEVEATAAIQNKIGQFISNPLIRNIVGQPQSSIDMRKAMDEGKIIILNLSKGRVGEDNSKLLGALLVTKIYLAAMSRVNVDESQRKDFYLYVDEFQNFATEAFINILSESRKYHLCLTLAHQYIAQMEDPVRDAVFGNVGTIITFRIGAEDAEWMEREFSPTFEAPDFVNLTKYNIYLRLMIDGMAGQPFSAATLPPFSLPEKSYVKEIIANTRQIYAVSSTIVTADISHQAESIGGGPSGGAHAVGAGGQAEITLYDGKCSSCGKEVKVPFKPDGKRPVYCKNCLKKASEAQESSGPAPHQQEARQEIHQEIRQEAPPSKPDFASLSEIKKDENIAFFTPKEKVKEKFKPVKKEVNVSTLKDLIKDAPTVIVKKEEPIVGGQEASPQKGKLKPGDAVKF